MNKPSKSEKAKSTPFFPQASSANQSSSRKKKIVLGASAGVVMICVFLALFLPFFIGTVKADTVIRIPKNASSTIVKDSVEKYLGANFAGKVARLAKMKGTDFSQRHGSYLIPEGASAVKAAQILCSGAQNPVSITINGFRLLSSLASRLPKKLDFSEKEFLAAATDSIALQKYGLSPEEALSLFIDDSYQLYWSASPNDVIRKVGAHYNEVWNKERRAKADSLGLTPAEVMILCSIVDEETNKLEEKGAIGRLYINRLRAGMKLQADPTVRYATGDFTIRRILSAHLKTESPYNTYLYKGLPPGPIRTTSVKTIDEVLNAAPHDYIYMCAKEDFSGLHNFAVTYEEHLQNARRYQKALDDKGIK